MGFASSRHSSRQTAITAKQMRRFPHDTAEKLPIDQLVRFAISLSLAKVTKKSVAAEQTLPIIMPTTSSIAML